MKYAFAKETLIGLLFSFLLLYVLYPGFVVFDTTPMHSSSWELADSAVSYSNFKPSFRVFQYELLNNFNLLWSSKRVMGMPLLANDIQAAPLFPLTLALSWLDQDFFWNVFIGIRLILIGLGSYLLARSFLQFQRFPAFVFVIIFGYALYVMRWVNNPWQNGLLAGVWYLLFLYLISKYKKGRNITRLLTFLGLSLTVYSMVTCGFPEAAVMSAILVVLVYVPYIFSQIIRKNITWKPYLVDLFGAHVVGFSLSSYQFFSIIELMTVSETFRYVGNLQYNLKDIFPFFAENLTLFSQNPTFIFKDSRTFFGLIPFSFFVLGIIISIKKIKRLDYGEVGALLCGLFILIKLFPIGPGWLNLFISNLPILKESYFFVYFFSIFLWFFAYFAAYGVQDFTERIKTNEKISLSYKLGLLILSLSVIVFTLYCESYFSSNGQILSKFHYHNNPLVPTLLCYIISIILFFTMLYLKLNQRFTMIFAACVILTAIIYEIKHTYPQKFHAWGQYDYSSIKDIMNQLDNRNIPLAESRIQDRLGKFTHLGIATIDTGATPMLPVRTKLFRTNFFNTLMAGHFPIDSVKNKYSWGITSTNIRSLDRYHGATSSKLPVWKDLQKRDGGIIQFDDVQFNNTRLDFNKRLSVTNHRMDLIYMRGWAADKSTIDSKNTRTYLIFKNNSGEVTVPTRKNPRHDVAHHLGDSKYLFSGWDTYMSVSILQKGDYTLHIRSMDKDGASYIEKNMNISLSVRESQRPENKRELIGVNNNEKDFLGVLGEFYIYYDKTALPRAYIASECENAQNIPDIIGKLERMSTFSLGKIYIEDLESGDQEYCSQYKSKVQRVPIMYDKGDDLLLQKFSGPAILVLNDNIYPGWKALDIKSNTIIPIKPVNMTFRGLLFPDDGEYQIRFIYRPDWLIFARMLLITGVLLTLFAILRTFFIVTRNRK